MLFIVFCYCSAWNTYYFFIHLEEVYMKYYFYNIKVVGFFCNQPACMRILVGQHLGIFWFACQIIVMVISLSFKFPFPSKEFTAFHLLFAYIDFVFWGIFFSSGMPYFSIGFYYYFLQAFFGWFFIAFVLYHFYILQVSSLSLTSLLNSFLLF